jgi:DNA-binding LytR/AlgR family response regulator
MRVVIIEDERLAAERLADLLRNLEPAVTILAVLESVEDSVNWFAQHESPDLVFMDVQLEDGISFEIFEEVKIDAPVIFTTAFDEYALRAFKVNSVDYLLKPLAEEDLVAAIRKFRRMFENEPDFEQKVKRVIEQVARKYKSRFFLKIGSRFQSVPVTRICCFFVEERNTFLKTTEGKTYDLDLSLDQLETLVDPEQFFRVNRNFLVNMNAIAEIVSYSTNRLKLKLDKGFDEGVIVSRDKVSDFKRWMDK